MAQLQEVVKGSAQSNVAALSGHRTRSPLTAGEAAALRAIDPKDFTQIFFTTKWTVELSLVPSDELPMLLKERFDRPTIDLRYTGDAITSTSVLVVIRCPAEKDCAPQRPSPEPSTRVLLPQRPGQPRPKVRPSGPASVEARAIT